MNSGSSSPDRGIVKFLHRHHVLTLATTSENTPWCASCFYVYDEKENIFIFTSDIETRHIAEGMKQPKVAGTVALETKIIGKIRGVQFSGQLKKVNHEVLHIYKLRYLKRFPYVAPFLGDTEFWIIDPEYFKMTDNRLGFGTKLIWEKHGNEH